MGTLDTPGRIETRTSMHLLNSLTDDIALTFVRDISRAVHSEELSVKGVTKNKLGLLTAYTETLRASLEQILFIFRLCGCHMQNPFCHFLVVALLLLHGRNNTSTHPFVATWNPVDLMNLICLSRRTFVVDFCLLQ